MQTAVIHEVSDAGRDEKVWAQTKFITWLESRLRELKTWVRPGTGPEATIDALMSATSVSESRPPARK